MNAILTMSSFIFPLITFPYITRVLGPSGTGVVALATSWVTYFSMFAQLGIPTYGVRACAKVRDDKEALSRTAIELFTINFVLGIVSTILFFLLIASNSYMRNEKTLYLIMSSFILFNSIGMEWLFKGLEKYDYITKRSIAFKIVAVIAMFAFVKSQNDYVIYGRISIFASSASNVLNLIHSRKYLNWKHIGNLNFRRHLQHVWVFFAMACASTIYTNLDTVMLGFMTSNEDVGYYSAAIKIKTVLVGFVTSLGNVLLPRSSYYVEKNMMLEFKGVSKKALTFVMFISLPLCVFFIVFAREAVLLLSGQQYIGSIVPMQIIMPTLILIGITNILGLQILVPIGKEKQVMKSEFFGAITDAIINLLLIPKYRAAGAAAGTLIAEVVVFVTQYRTIKSLYPEVLKHVKMKVYLISSGLSALVSYGCIKCISLFASLHNFALLTSAFCIFVCCYAGILIIRKDPMAMEIEILVKKYLDCRNK